MPNIVYIATSMDGYIADRNGGLEWLSSVPNPGGLDFGWKDFMNRIDALIMGRVTFETVLGFNGGWPYNKPVFVISNTLKTISSELTGKVEIIRGPLEDSVEKLNNMGYENIYVDGGKTTQNFLRAGLIDELIITTIPVLLGGGTPLFGKLPDKIHLRHVKTEIFLNAIIQSHYKIMK